MSGTNGANRTGDGLPTDDAIYNLQSFNLQSLQALAENYAVTALVRPHFDEVRGRRQALVKRTQAAVQDRLTKEIIYWDRRAGELEAQEKAGKTPRLNSARARQRADELEARRQKRLEELDQEGRLSPMPPVVVGGALVVPAGLLARLGGTRQAEAAAFARETRRVELLAMQAVTATERALGYSPRDVSEIKCGYDIESKGDGPDAPLRFIEVKGRTAGAETVTITKNEVLTGLNKPDEFILALVEVPSDPQFDEGDAFQGVAETGVNYETALPPGCRVRYVRHPFTREPDFGVTSVNYNLRELWARSDEPG